MANLTHFGPFPATQSHESGPLPFANEKHERLQVLRHLPISAAGDLLKDIKKPQASQPSNKSKGQQHSHVPKPKAKTLSNDVGIAERSDIVVKSSISPSA